MTQPMYAQPPRWWDVRWVFSRRPWMVILHTTRWEWYDSVFRFNGGGYLYGADPYMEWTVGCVTVRKYGMPKQNIHFND